MKRDAAIRLLLVEDDLDVAAGIGEFMALHGIEVDFAASVAEALHVVAGAGFNVLVLDLQLPDGNGIDLCRRLRTECGIEAPLLFLTAQGALDSKLRAFEAGAVDYMVKPFEPAELLARVRAIVGHAVRRPQPGITVGEYRLDVDGHTLYRGERHVALSATATALLACLMRAHPSHVGRERLCSVLWDGAPPDSDPLRMHVLQLRRSLQAGVGQALVTTLRGVGYRFSPDSTEQAGE
jgi:DNA-binding response OmpR family regulator